MPHERPRSQALTIVAALPVIAAAAAFGLTAGVFQARPDPDAGGLPLRAAAFAAACAVLIGAPAAHWAIASGRRGAFSWIGLGTVAGAVIVAVPLTGHLAGTLIRGDLTFFRLTWGVLVRAILDALGMGALWRATRSLLLIELLPVVGGAVTAAIFWGLVVRRMPARDRR